MLGNKTPNSGRKPARFNFYWALQNACSKAAHRKRLLYIPTPRGPTDRLRASSLVHPWLAFILPETLWAKHIFSVGSMYIYIYIWPRATNIVLFNSRTSAIVAHTPWAASGSYPFGSQWPIPLWQPEAHTPWQPVAHTNVSHRGPYTRQQRFSHFGFRQESFLTPSGVDPDIFTACLSAPGTLFYFLVCAVLLRFIRDHVWYWGNSYFVLTTNLVLGKQLICTDDKSCTRKTINLYWRQILY
jgi:hypothetical protein